MDNKTKFVRREELICTGRLSIKTISLCSNITSLFGLLKCLSDPALPDCAHDVSQGREGIGAIITAFSVSARVVVGTVVVYPVSLLVHLVETVVLEHVIRDSGVRVIGGTRGNRQI
jgi:hypothetical protein